METAPSPEHSELFCSQDADLTISSSDGVVFKVHRLNLGFHSDVFPGIEPGVPVQDEIVPLAEKASTLELLFQFVYRQRQPDLSKVDVDELALLAEAAEKYSIYSAMEVCKLNMRAAIPKIPLKVLAYAARHGYKELCDEAAPYTVDEDAALVAEHLDAQLFANWVLYREHWLRRLFEVQRGIPSSILHEDFEEDECPAWPPFVAAVLQDLNRSISGVQGISAVFDKHFPLLEDCEWCYRRAGDWLHRSSVIQWGMPSFGH
ncbi:hypothetical protein DAEQUDRAFT_710338 [Daedalea quercina L-15889]|uniref:BTB domain-containing protein n=1 Tax=Daedalea quercina L-15889 TaxID=1314783 RepID=A0A165QGL0_9APHY|nr:hypothetical protein DAEQUDRAFT_710338 [Daedalea quercina L-15889]